ncbi:MAG: hypothetical protein K9N06_03325 [Candidatus Cloacimonetes bacterium]|nr:hypothetical protein [Candidatus Cloacimonadota bacterium]
MGKTVLFLLIVMLLLGGCAGTTKPEDNTTEAFKIDLLEHKGDTGDIIKNSYGMIIDTLNCYYGADSTFYEFENNGIDAYFEGDWIYIPWKHISDPTTVSLEVFRFSYTNYQNHNAEYIENLDFIPFYSYNKDYYIDTFSGNVETIVEETWFYFVKTTNADGDTAFSDTTGYCLVNKPLLREPADGQIFSQADTLIFEWDLNSSNSAIKYRLLLFNENYELLWHYNLLSDEEPLLDYFAITGSIPEPGIYIWRVDAIIERMEQLPIDDKIIEVHSGAESMERSFTFN